MPGTTDEDKQTQKHGAKTGAETRIVVSGALPDGEAIREEMVIPCALRSFEEFLDETQAREAVRGCFGGGVDFGI